MSLANNSFPLLNRGRTLHTKSFCFSFSNPTQFDPDKFADARSDATLVDVRSINQWKSYFDATKVDDKLLVIEFKAAWCGPCKQIEPYLKELALNFRDVRFIMIDVDNLPSVAREFEANSMPTFVFVKRGQAVDKLNSVARDEIWDMIVKNRL